MQFSSIWSIDRTLSSATTPGQIGPGSNGNEGILCIPQSPSITETSPSDCFVSYPEHLFGGGVPTLLQRCSQCILQPQPTGQFLKVITDSLSNTHYRQQSSLLLCADVPSQSIHLRQQYHKQLFLLQARNKNMC